MCGSRLTKFRISKNERAGKRSVSKSYRWFQAKWPSYTRFGVRCPPYDLRITIDLRDLFHQRCSPVPVQVSVTRPFAGALTRMSALLAEPLAETDRVASAPSRAPVLGEGRCSELWWRLIVDLSPFATLAFAGYFTGFVVGKPIPLPTMH